MKAASLAARLGRAFGFACALGVLPPAQTAPLGEQFRVGPNVSAYPSLAADAQGNFAVAYSSWADTLLQRFDSNGNEQGGPVHVSTSTGATFRPFLAMGPAGDMVVAWLRSRRTAEGFASDLYARRFDRLGAPLGPEFQVNTTDGSSIESPPALTVDGRGGFAVAWTEWSTEDSASTLRVRRSTAEGDSLRAEIVLQTFPGYAGTAAEHIVFDADGNVVVVWQKNNDRGELWFSRIDAAEQVSSHVVVAPGPYTRFPRIGTTADGFIFGWLAYDETAGRFHVYSQRLWPDGSTRGNPVRANQTLSSGYGLSMSANASGWVLAWDGPDLWGGPGLFARRFGPDGTPNSPEIALNDSRGFAAQEPGVAMSPGGGFIATWFADDIYGWRYSADTFVDLSVDVEDSRDPVSWGDSWMYYVKVANVDPVLAASGATVDMTLSESAGIESVESDGWTCSVQAPIRCAYATPLPSGAEAPWLVVSVRAPASSPYPWGGDQLGILEARVASVHNDPQPANSSASETTQISDMHPDPFTFATQAGVDLAVLQVSDPVTITGIPAFGEGGGVPISVSSGGFYSINGSEFTSVPGRVWGYSQVRVAHVSASGSRESTTTTLTIGYAQGTFTTITADRDVEPDSFAFEDRRDVETGAFVISNAVTISGINDGAPVEVAGGAYSIDGAPFATSRGTVRAGQSIRVRHYSASDFLATATTTLTVGGVSATFSSTTRAPPDITPEPFAFPSRTGLPRGTLVVSEAVVVSGIDAAAPISVFNGAYSVAGGPFTAEPGMVASGQSVRVQLLSGDGFLQRTDATITIGGVSGTFSVTTEARDTLPDPFAFQGLTDVERGAEAVSDEIVVSGINDATVIEVQKGKYSIDGGAFTNNPGTVLRGQRIRVRHNAASDFSASKTTTLVIGGVAGTFTSTTVARDATPDPFHFEDRSGALPRAEVTSNAVRINGINDVVPIAIQVEGGDPATGLLGAEAEYSVNGSTYTGAAGSVQAGDSVTLKVRAPIEPGATIRLRISIGEGSDTWEVTTAP